MDNSPSEILADVPLAPLTTFGIGGPARFFLEAHNQLAVLGGLDFAEAHDVPVFILGGGSNILVADKGFPGLVIRMGIKGISEVARTEEKVLLVAGAGEDWDTFVQFAVERGFAGIECLSGIPGTVGGTPIQNVGAYGQEVSEVIHSVQVWDRRAGEMAILSNAECGFAYRQGIFNTTRRDRYIVLSVTFALSIDGAPALRYADLRNYFSPRVSTPTLPEVREAVRTIRAGKAMLLVRGDPDCRSAGSFFKNPIVSEKRCAEIAAVARGSVPHYALPEDSPGSAGVLARKQAGKAGGDARAPSGRVKLAAAWLIEQSGFYKGYGRGPVGISSKHTLALVNRGGACAQDVIALMREIQKGVRDRFGIELVPEPLFIGFHE